MLTNRFDNTYDKQDYVLGIAVIGLEIVHESLWRHIEDTLLSPLEICF